MHGKLYLWSWSVCLSQPGSRWLEVSWRFCRVDLESICTPPAANVLFYFVIIFSHRGVSWVLLSFLPLIHLLRVYFINVRVSAYSTTMSSCKSPHNTFALAWPFLPVYDTKSSINAKWKMLTGTCFLFKNEFNCEILRYKIITYKILKDTGTVKFDSSSCTQADSKTG